MSLLEARRVVGNAHRISVLTGAGISAESGIPTFRGAAGLWRQFRPEQLATPEAFARDPQLVWEWYQWRRGLIAKANPNPGHSALAEFEKRAPSFTLVTQNVDGLHQRVGSKTVVELHGSIWTLRCTACGAQWQDYKTDGIEHLQCSCGELARPGVVWFGESLPPAAWQNAEKAVGESDLLLVVGTSAIVYPAASLVPFARCSGAQVIEVNVESSAASGDVDIALIGKAGEILPQLLSD